MNDLNEREFLQEFKYLKITNANLLTTVPIIHLVGYGLLILAVLDSLAIIFPLNLLDPYWLLTTLEQLVKMMPLSLIALVFIFYGKNLYRDRHKNRILKIIHWSCFGWGILFLLFVPWGMIDTVIIYQSGNLDAIALIKTSSKSILGALVSGILSLEIWRRNKWVTKEPIIDDRL
jgi:hypothetical protein